MKLRPFLKYWLPAIVWMLLIAVASSDMMSAQHTSRFIGPFLRWLAPDISPATIADVQLFIRKCAHLTEYAILGILLARAFFRGQKKATARDAILIWLIALVWAGLDEFHQSFVASRTGSPIDVMIDATGALAGLGVYWVFTRRSWATGRGG